ncbi:NAD-dependent succinate-semialdehyde dehydrogenase [Mycolicibacterium austroafricanum]|uniref:NAD-dependent succinate-semialdehyde dehydrogenase n=1 Tax=Mycolicibacterium austroafricanum TaxID=39687 RepID=A0ABT8HNK8_MYCAO|nr:MULTISPECIES: NAD-dependent succinate-semialdehyde dehydrogenase [Mycolicibacterium]MDN4522339.1 NAD-dependent succinate-semialdehyde dehydrogenase [Mycolicibacterium austroafricanum]QRZ08474.1 NAD-dependent succinate-semialdehyde dehydrogenase [Mycolicibacterium austroafricanum]QZT58646.1 NAD-dependent succinate-semialdehyde dehydrogenase [Mycolicibacterium austroafricanum]QZT70125.1 NAD-dependent succinate-semialdehyde dehydrogenase [Mycolicibacterium austroafricanum]UJL26423.1 NAD-depend
MTATQPPYRTLNPATGEVLATFDTATDDLIATAITAADDAYRAWREQPLEARVDVVRHVGRLLRERATELAELAKLEMGKKLDEGTGEVEFSASIFEFYADHAAALLADQRIPSFSGGTAVVQRRPVGVLLGVMPWNFPVYQVARFAAPNLVLGNTILLKHAESVPQCALVIADVMRDAGVPEGVYTNLFASFDQVETIIGDPRVQGVSVTGSERAGAAVAATAGRSLKKCLLELGGSDPFIVLDGDSKQLARTAWEFRVYNMGQACNSNKRMIVTDDLYDDFVAELVTLAGDLAPAEIAPMSSRKAAETLAAQVADAVDKGATLHVGGELAEGPAAFYTPAVLTGVTPDMRAYSEELFGPVAVVYRVRDEDEAVALANASAYGLGASVFSTDTARAEKVAQRLEAGMVNVNTPAGEGPDIPFGGVKRSGFGRELGALGIDEFVNKQVYVVAD